MGLEVASTPFLGYVSSLVTATELQYCGVVSGSDWLLSSQ
jgi:hypothetical protein